MTALFFRARRPDDAVVEDEQRECDQCNNSVDEGETLCTVCHLQEGAQYAADQHEDEE